MTTKGPSEQGREVRREWAATYTVAGAPDLWIGGSERAVYRGDRIELLEVVMTQEIWTPGECPLCAQGLPMTDQPDPGDDAN